MRRFMLVPSVSVSAPQRLVLVRQSFLGIEETTLVVPDLPVERLEYARFLVDGGTTFEEHAVGEVERALASDEVEIIVRALSAARRTVVSLYVREGDGTHVLRCPSEEGCAAMAVSLAVSSASLADDALPDVRLTFGSGSRLVGIERLGQFFEATWEV